MSLSWDGYTNGRTDITYTNTGLLDSTNWIPFSQQILNIFCSLFKRKEIIGNVKSIIALKMKVPSSHWCSGGDLRQTVLLSIF